MSSVLLYIKKMYILASNASSFFLVAGAIWPSSGTGCSFPFLLMLVLVGSLEPKHEITVVPCPHIPARCPEVGSHGSSLGRAHCRTWGCLVEGLCFQEKHMGGGRGWGERSEGSGAQVSPKMGSLAHGQAANMYYLQRHWAESSPFTCGICRANCSSGISQFILDPISSVLAAERLGVHGVSPPSGLTLMVAGIAALAWLLEALMETLSHSLLGKWSKMSQGETILIPFTGGAEGWEEVGYSKCHTGLELECLSKWDSVCCALPLWTGANVEGKLLRAVGSPAQGTHGTAGSVEGLEVGLGSLVRDGTLRDRIDQEGYNYLQSEIIALLFLSVPDLVFHQVFPVDTGHDLYKVKVFCKVFCTSSVIVTGELSREFRNWWVLRKPLWGFHHQQHALQQVWKNSDIHWKPVILSCVPACLIAGMWIKTEWFHDNSFFYPMCDLSSLC